MAAALSGVFSLFAAPVVFTADEAALEHGGIVGFYERSQAKPEVRIDGNSAIQIPTSSGGSTIFSQSNADVQLTRTQSLVGLRYAGRVQQLRYSAMVGQFRKYEVEFASGSSTNRLDASDTGLIYGVGLAGSFIPESIASVGIGWDLQARESRVDFERFHSDSGTVPANQRLVEDELQLGVTATKRFGELAPYAGGKVNRWITRLEDKGSGAQLSGHIDKASALVGVEWTPMPDNAGFVEASFFGDESVSAGWGFRF